MSGLPTVPVHAIDAQPDAPQIRDLWSAAAVGVIGGLPKSCKSWFGLDLAVSVASATAALDRFEVLAPGPALVYLAEDFLPRVRERVAHLCRHRGLDLSSCHCPEDQALVNLLPSSQGERSASFRPVSRST